MYVEIFPRPLNTDFRKSVIRQNQYLTHIAAISAKNQKNLLITNGLLTISELCKFLKPHCQ